MLYVTRLPVLHRSQPRSPALLFPPAPKILFATGASNAWLAFSPKSIEMIEKCTHSCIPLFFNSKCLAVWGSGWLGVAPQGGLVLFPLEVGIADNLELLPSGIVTARASLLPGLSRAAAWLEGGIPIRARRSLKINVRKNPKHEEIVHAHLFLKSNKKLF